MVGWEDVAIIAPMGGNYSSSLVQLRIVLIAVKNYED